MTQDEIIEMARKSGALDYYEINLGVDGDEAALLAFAKLVAAKERELCAQSVETIETYEKIEKACFKFAAKTIRERCEA